MREVILRDYFKGERTVSELNADLHGAVSAVGKDVVRVQIENMSDPFVVTRHHLLKLCADAIAGTIPPASLEAVAFCIIASDNFDLPEGKDGDLLSEILFCWDTPSINYPLNLSTLKKFHHWLETGEKALSKDDFKRGSA